jgi:hypothetical protein
LAASQSLSQLSYGPWVPSKSSREVEIISPIDSLGLVVLCGPNAERQSSMTFDTFDGYQKTSVKGIAVGRYRVDLSC